MANALQCHVRARGLPWSIGQATNKIHLLMPIFAAVMQILCASECGLAGWDGIEMRAADAGTAVVLSGQAIPFGPCRKSGTWKIIHHISGISGR
jgi:hypothetical protein